MLVMFYVILISSFHSFRPPGMDGYARLSLVYFGLNCTV